MATNPNQTSEERRLELDAKLRLLIGNGNVYFQPPESVRIKYPCLIYKFTGVEIKHADNGHYYKVRKYDMLHVHRDPDTDFIDSINTYVKYASFDRRYISDNLYHDAYIIYY